MGVILLLPFVRLCSACRETQGLYKGDKSSVWGITVLLFNDKQIKEAASIFQPFPKMRKSISKGG